VYVVVLVMPQPLLTLSFFGLCPSYSFDDLMNSKSTAHHFSEASLEDVVDSCVCIIAVVDIKGQVLVDSFLCC
jgi:hypothetical protein